MLFAVIAVPSILGLLFFLTYRRYSAGRGAMRKTIADYLSWLWSALKILPTEKTLAKARDVFSGRIKSRYPGWTLWIFIALAATFFYQSASGFLFAVFSPRGLFGFPLLLHVMSGGLFAVSLTLALLWRARDYSPGEDAATAGESFARPVFKKPSDIVAGKCLFWIFAAAGLCLMTTALCSMLPVFTFNTQKALIHIHRYSALVALLAASAFVDLVFVPRGDRP